MHDIMALPSLPQLERDDSESERGSISESDSEIATPITSSPFSEEEDRIMIWSSIPKTHRVKRTLKPCLRLRDASKTIPLRAPGCKGSRRNDGDETPRTVSWGWEAENLEDSVGSVCSESENESGNSTPLEKVFFVEKCELDLMGVEMLVVRDERVCGEKEEVDEEDECEGERRGSLLSMRIERRLSL